MKNTSTIRFAWLPVVLTLLALSMPFRSVAQEHKFIDLKNNKAELSDGANLLCFDVFEIRIAITNAEGLCTWIVDNNSKDHLKESGRSGAYGDTITYSYTAVKGNSKQLSIRVEWMDAEGKPFTKTLYYSAACDAAQPGDIMVLTKSGTTRIGYVPGASEQTKEVYCEGLQYQLKVNEGPVRDYSSLAPLQYGWFVASSPEGTGSRVQEYQSGSEKNTALSSVSLGLEGRYWQVRAKTCDDGYSTKPSSKKIENIIRKTILPDDVDLTVKHIRYAMPKSGNDEGGSGGGSGGGMGGGGGATGPLWVPIDESEDDGEANNIACVYYSSAFNGKRSNIVGESMNTFESVNGYIDLEAGPFDIYEDTLFPHYRFRWIFDTADLEIATDKMVDGTLRCPDSGFGADRSRICFKVKEHPLTKEDSLAGKTRDKIHVSVEVYCPECEAEAARNEATDTIYRKKSKDGLTLTRADSIPHELPYTTELRDRAGELIDYKTELPELCGRTPHMFCASATNYTGNLTFMWVVPSDEWVGTDAKEGCAGIITPEIAQTETHFGDTCQLYVYPRNQCFRNGSLDIHLDTVTVYVKALPPAPRIYDPVDTRNPLFTGVKEEDIGDDMEKFPKRPSILLCNYNQANNGLPNRDYYLISRNSPIPPQKFSDHAKEGGYVMELPEGYTDADISYEIRSIDGSTKANDTNIVRIIVKEAAYNKLKDQKQLAFGFAAANECGTGSTRYFPINIIDTLNVYAHVKQLDHPDPGLDSAAWTCEGEVWRWTLEGTDDRFITDPLVEKGGDDGGMGGAMGGGGSGEITWTGADRNTDRVEYVWTFTDPTWHFLQASSEGANPTSVVFGENSGQVRLALRNRCGLSRPRAGDYVNVNPFTRVKIKVTGTEIEDTRRDAYDPLLAQGAPGAAPNQEFLAQPCRDTRLVYAADTSYLTEEYLWCFPSDWVVIDEPGYETATWIGENDSANYARTKNTDLLNPNFGINEMRVMVHVGADTGDIMVIGRKSGCHFAYDNVSPDLSRDELPYGHRADSLFVFVRPFTGKPSLHEWPNDFCARTTQTLTVSPDPTQDAKTREETYFTWTFPEDWAVNFRNAHRDTVDVVIPNRITKDTTINGTTFRSDTVKVYSHRYDCDPTNKGDSSIHVFRLVDTLSLDSGSMFRDLLHRGTALNLSPCEGDTVEYTLDGSFHAEMDSIVFRWSLAMDLNGTHDFVTGDTIDLTGWRVLNEEGKYSANPRNPTTGLKMIVGRAPIRILAYGAAHCGESSPTKFLDLTPISLVRDKATWVTGGDVLCEKERAVFQHDSIQYATAYEWHYPWGGPDTLQVGDRGYIRRTFSDTTAFAKGDVYVVPFNRCGPGPESDKINITDVIGHLNAPGTMTVIAENGLARNVVLNVVADTAFDTVCLRNNYTYKAAYTDNRYTTSAWKFDWFGLSEPFSDSLAIQAAADSSEARFFKRADTTSTSGFSFVNIGVRVRHEQCRFYGDTLTLKVLPYDTAVALSGLDYIVNLETGKADIQTKPCGAATAKWSVNKAKFEPAVSTYQFVWSGGNLALGRRWSNTDKKMDGTYFEWINGTAESGDGFSADETLHFSIPNFLEHPDSLRMAVNVRNRCGVSHLPAFVVKSEEALTGKDGLRIKPGSNANFCDREQLTFVATPNSHVNSRIWYYPWNTKGDTITGESHLESTPYSDSLQEGWVYFVGVNGCGEGPKSDSIYISDIKRILAAPRNPSFDSLCMNQPAWLKATFPSGTDPNNVEILWTKLRGQAGASVFEARQNTDSCRLAPTDVKAEPLRISVKTRVKGCQRYSDSLVINIVSMDTLAFVIPTGDEDEVLGKFDLDLSRTIVAGGSPVDLTPCAGSRLVYDIKVDPAKAWSLDKTFESYLSWNRVGATPSLKPDADMHLGGSNWMFDDDSGVDTLGKVHYGQLPLVVGASDNLYFHVTLKNRCGISRSQGLSIVPDRKVTQKPRINPKPLCLGAEVSLMASNLQDVVETLDWEYPWTPYYTKTNKDYPFLDVTVGPENGKVILWAGNHCEAHSMSDTLYVDAVMKVPQQPAPAWLPEGKPYTWKDADTVVEYICLHGETALTVKPGPEDGKALQFVWRLMSGAGKMAVRRAEGASYILAPNDEATLNDSALLAVCGNYPDCGNGYYGDTLYIRVRLVDTLSLPSTGKIVYQSKNTDNETILCPDAELLLSMEPPVAGASYHWVLPGNNGEGAWKIKGAEGNPNLSEALQFPVPGDSNFSSVVAIVGETGGRVSVQLRTPASVLGCRYFSTPIVLDENFTVRTRPDAPAFITFVQKPCVGQETDYAIEPILGARAYRWQIPAGWEFKENSGTVRQDTIWEVSADEINATHCTLLVGKDTGYVRVWAVDSCNGGPAVSLETARLAYPQDTARLTVLGDHASCIDSTIYLQVCGVPPYTLFSEVKYKVDIKGKGKDNFNWEGDINQSFLSATSHSFDTVEMVFTPVFDACPNNVEEYVHIIVADTTPEIKGSIVGATTACSDNIYEYKFHLNPEMGPIDITCTWEISSDVWTVVAKPNDTTVVLHFSEVPADTNGVQIRTTDTLICHPRGMCGTGLPVKLPIALREADPFNDEVVVSNIKPCLGTEIDVRLRNKALYDPYPDSIKFVWNTPDNWQRITADGQPATDSLSATRYYVHLDTADAVIAVRMWRKGGCGLSQTLRSTPVHVRDSAAKPAVIGPYMLHPCYTRTAYNIVLQPKEDVDSAIWTLPTGLTLSLSTSAAAAFKYDSLWIDNPDSSLAHISLPVRTVNECGHRDTVFVVRPITDIEPFADRLHIPRPCFGDTAYAWIQRPLSQIDQEVWYVWDLRDSTHTFLKQWSDTVAVMEYLVSPAGDSVYIHVTAVNDCAADSNQRAASRPYNFQIWPLPGSDTVVYGQGGVRLSIDSVAPGEKDDYTYVWTPSNRVVDSVPATRTLVQAVETFYVRAQQKAGEGYEQTPFYRRDRLCAVNDSVKIVVDSVFQFVPFSADTICVELVDSLLVQTFGGNRENYHIQWYEKVDDSTWEQIPALQDSVLFTLPVFETPGTYYYRVVGFDSTFLRNEETDALIMMVSHYDTLEISVQVYDMQVYFRNIASEEVSVPMGGRVEFLMRIEDGSGRYRYDWTPDTWVSTLDSTDGTMNTVALFREGEMTLAVTDSASGCVREATVRVKPGKGNNIPNVITPNGDGYNDIFLKGVSRLTIFTSWGERIFHTEDGLGWDGSRNGQPVRPGEYLYVAEIDGEDGSVRTVKGVVTVKYE